MREKEERWPVDTGGWREIKMNIERKRRKLVKLVYSNHHTPLFAHVPVTMTTNVIATGYSPHHKEAVSSRQKKWWVPYKCSETCSFVLQVTETWRGAEDEATHLHNLVNLLSFFLDVKETHSTA